MFVSTPHQSYYTSQGRPSSLYQKAGWKRACQLVHLIHFRFNLSYTNQNEFDYFRNIILPNTEYSWTESLYIDDIINRLNLIVIFKRLRSLTINHLQTKNIHLLTNTVLPELKQLDRLSLHSDFVLKSSDINLLTAVIFSEQMSSLTYCCLGFYDNDLMTFDHLDTKHRTLSLITLVIDQWCRLTDLIRLLHAIPNIQRLTVRLLYSRIRG